MVKLDEDVRTSLNGRLVNIGPGNLIHVGGDLKINFNGSSDITGLSKLTKVDCYYSRICNINLASIIGLNKLTNVESLEIRENDVLSGIIGLPELVKVGRDLKITNNGGLVNITGLGNFTDVCNSVDIAHNGNLSDFIGIFKLVQVDGVLKIQNNARRVSICGVRSLPPGGGQFLVEQSQKLIRLNTKLEMVGRLKICVNESLDSLE